MPEVEHQDTSGFSFSATVTPDKPEPKFFSEVVPAAFRQENDVLNTFQYLVKQKVFEPTPGFNPMTRLKELDAENRTDHWARYGNDFTGVLNENQFTLKYAALQQEEKDKQTLSAAGVGGTLAMIAAGTLSPTILLPFIGEARGLKAAGTAAAWGFAGGLAQEVPLQLNQETRTVGEGAFSVAASTVVSGLLGGAIGVLGKSERKALEESLARDMGMVGEPGFGAIPNSGSAGAAAVGRTQGAGKLASGLPDFVVEMSPVARTIDQTLLPSGQQIAASYSTGGLRLEGNAAGIASSAGGDIESLAKVYDAQYVKALTDLDSAYAEYFFGTAGKPSVLANARAYIGGAMSNQHLSKSEFKEEVSKALWSADKHENPHVQKVAETFRRDFFNPLLKEAQRVGIIPAEIDLKGDLSYLTRDYNISAIRANTNEFIDILAANYEKQAQVDYAKKVERLKAGEQKTNTMLEDLQLPADQVAQRQAQFKQELDNLEKGRLGFVKQAEDEIASLRRQSRAANKEGNYAEGKALLEEARALEESAGPMLKETKDDRRAIRQRLRNLSKSRVVFAEKQAKKLEKIERLEDINFDALQSAARHGQNFLNRVDNITEKEFEGEVKKFKSLFNDLGERYDAVGERIGKLSQDENVELSQLMELGGKQEKLAGKLDDALLRLEQAEDFKAAVPVFKDIIREQLDEVLQRINKNTEKRTLRAQRLREQAEQLDQSVVTKRIEDLRMASAAKREKFLDNMYAHGVDVDATTLQADFKEYARRIAVEAKDKIIGTHLRSATVDMIAGERGLELARAINVSSLEISKFLEQDIEKLLHRQVRTLGPDIEIARKFGTLDFGTIMQPVVEDYNKRLAQFKGQVERAKAALKEGNLTGAQKKEFEKLVSAENIEKVEGKINDTFFDVKRDIETLHDRVRHNFGLPDDAEAIGYRLGRFALKMNVLRLMGGTTISSIADVGRPIMKHGLTRVFGDGFNLLINDMKAFKASAREVRLAGAGLDVTLHSRAQALSDVLTDYSAHTRIERGVDFAVSKMGIINMLDPWTAAMKQFNGVVANARMLDSVEMLMTGKGSKKELAEATTFLAEHGFDGNRIRGIWDEMNNGGADKVKGTWLPNTEKWKDQDLVRTFRAAIVKNVDDTIVTPGVELPITMNRTIANRMLFQFKSFGMSSTYKTLGAGLQQRDMAVFNGVMVSLALGALSYYTHAMLAGGKTQETMLNADAAKWADEAWQRSGVSAIFGDAQKITERLPWIGKYTTASGMFGSGERLQQTSGNSLVESLLGPTFGFAKTLSDVIAGAEEPTQTTLHKLRTLMPFQNLVIFRRFLDAIEQASGLPERKN
jgi:hypothetical protein